MSVVKCSRSGCKSYVDRGETDTPLVEDLRQRGWQTVVDGDVTKHYCQAHKDPAVRSKPADEDE